jgi:hypothetical protein
MTLGGIWDMAEAAHGYSDPPAYGDTSGNRIDNLDLYRNSPYYKVWDSFFRGLQGDLHYPPYADSFRSTKLDVSYVELMVRNYPDRPEYLALLKESCGEKLELHSGSKIFSSSHAEAQNDDEPVLVLPYDLARPDRFSSFSLYYRKPGLENQKSPALKLSDWCPPVLKIGHLRTGDDGRESLLLLSASNWGGHHEMDNLNLYYRKNESEVLSDLGYLWDHPLKPQNQRTFAHNTVIIDEKDQLSRERKGEVLNFRTSANVKIMEMASSAYSQASLYRRTSAIIDHGNGQNYVVDFFRVRGGNVQDYVFHCSDKRCEVENLHTQPYNGTLYDLKNISSGSGSSTWKVFWKNGDMKCTAWATGQEEEEVFIGDGWGQRDWKNSDIGATIPYIVRRCRGNGSRIFISVFEGSEGTPFVRNVKLLDPSGVLMIETEKGSDYIMSSADQGSYSTGKGNNTILLQGRFAVVSVQEGKQAWKFSC